MLDSQHYRIMDETYARDPEMNDHIDLNSGISNSQAPYPSKYIRPCFLDLDKRLYRP